MQLKLAGEFLVVVAFLSLPAASVPVIDDVSNAQQLPSPVSPTSESPFKPHSKDPFHFSESKNDTPAVSANHEITVTNKSTPNCTVDIDSIISEILGVPSFSSSTSSPLPSTYITDQSSSAVVNPVGAVHSLASLDPTVQFTSQHFIHDPLDINDVSTYIMKPLSAQVALESLHVRNSIRIENQINEYQRM